MLNNFKITKKKNIVSYKKLILIMSCNKLIICMVFIILYPNLNSHSVTYMLKSLSDSIVSWDIEILLPIMANYYWSKQNKLIRLNSVIISESFLSEDFLSNKLRSSFFGEESPYCWRFSYISFFVRGSILLTKGSINFGLFPVGLGTFFSF